MELDTNKNGLFVTSRPAQWQEQLHGAPPRTPFGRALAELDIEWIAAHSPQAKGRIERLFKTLLLYGRDLVPAFDRVARALTRDDSSGYSGAVGFSRALERAACNAVAANLVVEISVFGRGRRRRRLLLSATLCCV